MAAKRLAVAGAKVVVNERGLAGVNAAVAKLRAAVPSADIRGMAAHPASMAGRQALVYGGAALRHPL